ncbi:MAG: HAD-IA family hydrolase, partial [Anaerolineales bacterium]|nr:HAD-IA family hydrolase [Anaerolineales bacterium]
SERFYNFALANNKIFQFFKGVTISAEIKLLKPQREIYDQFCKIHKLNPEECLFIDDKAENIQAAINAGWQAYQFKGVLDLVSYLETTLDIKLDQANLPQKGE